MFLVLTLTVPGFVYAQGFPQELQDMGFSEDLLIGYEEREGREYYIFYDWLTSDPSDVIIFVTQDGKVIETFTDIDTRGGELIEE